VEFLRGQLHARSGESLPVSVLANDTYADSLAFWSARQGRAAGGSSSHARFARAADAVSRMSADSSADPIDKAFRILSDVAQRSTRWSVVYDQTNREIAFRTDVHPMVRTVRFGGVNFGCSTPARLLDVHVKRAGDVTSSLEPYTEQRNRTLVVSSYRGFSGTRDTPDAEIERTVAHGSAANCAS